jgi:hypothetical protein
VNVLSAIIVLPSRARLTQVYIPPISLDFAGKATPATSSAFSSLVTLAIAEIQLKPNGNHCGMYHCCGGLSPVLVAIRLAASPISPSFFLRRVACRNARL